MADTEYVYYKKNVPYVSGGRMHPRDAKGFILTNENPYVAVPANMIRDFKIANKQSILDGTLIPSPEPSFDWETENAISDEQAVELVKGNFLVLKKTLEKVTAVPILTKMLEYAKLEDRPKKTIAAIEARIAEVSEEDDFLTPAMMRGVS